MRIGRGRCATEDGDGKMEAKEVIASHGVTDFLPNGSEGSRWTLLAQGGYRKHQYTPYHSHELVHNLRVREHVFQRSISRRMKPLFLVKYHAYLAMQLSVSLSHTCSLHSDLPNAGLFLELLCVRHDRPNVLVVLLLTI
jgi:hypothetical protein